MNKHFPGSSKPVKLYGLPVSGHAHRAELMLAFLDIPYEKIDVDLMSGAHKAPDFLNLNLFGQIPVIDDNGDIVSDSTAILVYLAKKYGGGAWLPEDPLAAAQVQRWLSVASNEVFAGPNSTRLVKLFGMPLDYEVAKTKTENLFATMEPHLQTSDFLAGSSISIADVACYTYISHVPEGGVSLKPYPAIGAWLARIEAYPGFVGMVRSPEPEPA